MNHQKTKTQLELELLEEILTVGSILIKFGSEHILEDQNLFIEFLNELGIRNTNNRELTRPSFMTIIERLKGRGLAQLIESFTTEFKNYYIIADLMIKHSTSQTTFQP